jgi:Ca2+-transporting ATPase
MLTPPLMPVGLTFSSEYNVPTEVKAAGFEIDADELASIVECEETKNTW